MATNLENFEAWYAQTLEMLYPVRSAGIPILMIVFPLLERHLRQRLKLGDKNLDNTFYVELTKVFPDLANIDRAREFWQVFRNGILHEVTLSKQSRSGTSMPIGWLSQDFPAAIEFNIAERQFMVDPVKLAKLIIQEVRRDFGTFDNVATSSAALPQVMNFPNADITGTGVATHAPIYLGTRSGP